MNSPVHYCANCGNGLEAGAHFCGVCGHELPPGGEVPPAPATPVPPAPPPVPTAPATVPPPTVPPPTVPLPAVPMGFPPPSGPAVPAQQPRRGGLIAAIGVLAVLLVGALVAAVVVVTRDAAPADADELLLEPVGYVPPEPFSPSVATRVEQPVKPSVVKVQAPISSTQGGQQVVGGQPGLYGGTKNNAVCDPEKLIAFLQSNTEKAKAWAGVLGIGTTEIASYVRSLTPVVLTRDTRVTNHGYANGKATTIPAVLQAGTAVMVDRFGVPRVKCGCGNPLTEPPPLKAKTNFRGTQWTGFTINNVVQITINVEVKVFVLVDIDTGAVFTRPPGIATTDTDVLADQLCQLFPNDPTCSGGTTTTAPSSSTTAAPSTTTTSATPPAVLAEIGNIGGVQNGPSTPSIVTLAQPSRIVEIMTYHWNDASGAPLGTISLRGPDGTVYGPFGTRGAEGQGGVPNAYWIADVDLTVPAGDYEVLDSDPSTWAQNAQSGGRGFTTLRGYTLGPAVNPTTTAAPPVTAAPTTTSPPSGARANEAAGVVRQMIAQCTPDMPQYITSYGARELDRDTLYQVDVHIVIDSGEWYAHFEVDFASEFPDVRGMDPESKAFVC